MYLNRSNQLKDRIAKKNLPYVLILCFSFCLTTPAFSQSTTETIQFEIQVLGLKIGDLNVKKYQVGDTLHYLATSNVKFWFFGNVDVEISTHSKYVNGYFVKSISKSNTNRGNYASIILWDGEKYVVDAESYKFENKEPVSGLVQWCSARTFFEELQGGQTFISEVYGLTAKIEELEPGAYSTTISGNENQYFYDAGKLQKVVLENSIKNFQYKRIN